MPAQHDIPTVSRLYVCLRKMSTRTNVEIDLWICPLLLAGGASPPRTAGSISHACFAVFAGVVPVEVPLICAIVVFNAELFSPYWRNPPHTSSMLYTSLHSVQPILSREPVHHIFARLVGQQSTTPFQIILLTIQDSYGGSIVPKPQTSLSDP